MKTKFFVLYCLTVCLIVCFAACKRGAEKPENLIGVEKMIAIEVDMRLAESFLEDSMKYGDTEYFKNIVLDIYKPIFKHHDVRAQDFKESLKYYVETKPKKMLYIEEEVHSRLREMCAQDSTSKEI